MVAALRRRRDPALAGSPLARLPGVRRRAEARFAGREHAAGLALREVLEEALALVAAELAALPATPAADRDRAALAALARAGCLAGAARELGIARNSYRYQGLVAVRARLARAVLWLAAR